MKTIHEILVLVKKEYLIELEKSLEHNSYFNGLCNTILVLFDNNIVSEDEYLLFIQYIYNPRNHKKELPDLFFAGFFWNATDMDSRLEWLDVNINFQEILK